MRYVRTKDGEIFEIVENIMLTSMPPQYQSVNGNGISIEKIIKQADTIEELCDEFIEYGNRPIVISQVRVIHGRMSGKTPVILGAVWTDKGLIYVAKMNDEGELELL